MQKSFRDRADDVAETWDSLITSERNPHYHYYRTTDLLVTQLLRRTRARRALEVGCGTAGCAIYALQTLQDNDDLHITGIDISPRMIELGQHNVDQAGLNDRITLEVGDAASLPYSSASFDVVFSRGAVLSYAEHPARLLSEARRVLHLEGAIGLDVLNRPPGKGVFIGKLQGFEHTNGAPEALATPLTYHEFSHEAQFQIIREYLIHPGTQLLAEVIQQFQALPAHLPGITQRPHYIGDAELIHEQRVRMYKPAELQQIIETAGFIDVTVYGEGYMPSLLNDEELRPFVNKHRDHFSKIEILLHGKLNLDYAVMLFVTGKKCSSL